MDSELNQEVIATINKLFASFQQGVKHMYTNSKLYPPLEIEPATSVQDNSDDDGADDANNVDSITGQIMT